MLIEIHLKVTLVLFPLSLLSTEHSLFLVTFLFLLLPHSSFVILYTTHKLHWMTQWIFLLFKGLLIIGSMRRKSERGRDKRLPLTQSHRYRQTGAWWLIKRIKSGTKVRRKREKERGGWEDEQEDKRRNAPHVLSKSLGITVAMSMIHRHINCVTMEKISDKWMCVWWSEAHFHRPHTKTVREREKENETKQGCHEEVPSREPLVYCNNHKMSPWVH